uniref:Uncharacterized protein n=1 Tax=Bionectria ochroleuca TaxID=29856 RepID=A0A0B7KSA1_BIOOC
MPTWRKVRALAILCVGGLVTIITALRIAALYRVNTSNFSYDHGYLGLLSTVGGIVGLIVCCAVSISWRIDDLLGLLGYSHLDLSDEHENSQQDKSKISTLLLEEGRLNIWLTLSYKNSINEKILEYGHHLAGIPRYSIARTFSYRINLLLANGLWGANIWVQLIWQSYGLGILGGLDIWRRGRLSIRTLTWAGR